MRRLSEIDRHEFSQESFLNLLKDCLTTYDIFRLLKSVCKNYDFHSFMVMRLPVDGQETLDDLVIVTNWNPEMVRAYDSMGFLAGSPVIEKLKQSTLPFDWEIEKISAKRSDGKDNESLDLFKEFDFNSGVYFPTNDHLGNRGALGLSSDAKKLNPTDFAELHFLATHFYDRIAQIELGQETQKDILTAREIDCLKWAASGKTSAETAIILGISENTVNHYMANSATKLDTVNKAHTVAKAMRLGLLRN